MYYGKVSLTFSSIWLVSSVALSNGVVAPELPILAQAKKSAEYPLLKQVQDMTLELQLLEITVKNRRDAQTEQKTSAAIHDIEQEGMGIGQKFKALRKDQIDALWSLIALAKRYGEIVGIAPTSWDELLTSLREGSIAAGMLTIQSKRGPLNLVNIAPLYIGHQAVWNISLPGIDRKSYWVQARALARRKGYRNLSALGMSALTARVEATNKPFIAAKKLTSDYFGRSYGRLYSAFEPQRYAILQRVQLARKALVELQKTNTAMGTPEELSSLYNQVLDNLFSYGIDISLQGSERAFAVKGFLFSESPERAEELLRKLKFTPTALTYNPQPST